MQITISGKNFDVSQALRDHVIEKLNAKIGRFDTIVTANVTMSTDRNRHIVEVTLFGKDVEMRAEERDSYDMYHSISTVVEKLEKQLGKARSRSIDISRKERDNERTAPMADDDSSPVKHVASYMAEPMSVEDAIRILEDKEYQFYAFHNNANGRINVVYATEHGYSLIDPKL